MVTREMMDAARLVLNKFPKTIYEFYFHDWFLYALARIHDLSWVIDDSAALVRYRQHSENVIGARNGVGAGISRLKRVRSGWYRAQITACVRLYKAIDPESADSRFVRLLELTKRNAFERLWLACHAIKFSRRRKIDRLVIGMAVLLGYI